MKDNIINRKQYKKEYIKGYYDCLSNIQAIYIERIPDYRLLF
jgi:hypothetical protein